ncbi:MAG: cache domain-containing protein [Spirochaetales bacterium]|nr:cache domain-containing protein [Spirochaetales bacterium]
MKISEHVNHTYQLYKLRAEDIHKWIDGYFDRESFEIFLISGRTPDYNPYDHRKFRHCREALQDAFEEFSHKYTKAQIRQVFECHIKDDYDNYIPSREDFTNGNFSEKYHEEEEHSEPILTSKELTRYFKGLYYGRNNNKRPRDKGFFLRIVIPATVAMFLFVTSVFFIILPLFHQSLLSEKEEMIMEISSVAVSILDYYISLEKEGNLTGVDARQAAVDEIRKLRYGPENDNYFWITDMHPFMIMHPWRTDLEGTDLSEFRDSQNVSGKRLFMESVTLVNEEGGGFLEYLWQLGEESNRIVPKLSYVYRVEPWNWIIGTGTYIHDVEDEISRLTFQLIYVFLGISFLLIILLAYMVIQSRSIEKNRRQAEAGLIEAKERYRALVEASNEGYILMMEQKNVFCNTNLQKMTGYSEDEILSNSVWEKLFPLTARRGSLETHLKNLETGNPVPDEFEAALHCRTGGVVDVIVRISRIFLSNDNGQVISIRPISRSTPNDSLFPDPGFMNVSGSLHEQISVSKNGSQIVRSLNQLPDLVRSMLRYSAEPEKIREFISDIYTTAVRKIIDLSIEEMDEPPVPFSFLSLGSSGRKEMTLFSDQDNALTFQTDKTGEELEKIRIYFLNLAHRVCSRLNQAGFSYCPGGIMAVNPAYCLSETEWKNKYKEWISTADNTSLLDIHVFFDISQTWGKEPLAENLQNHIFKLCSDKPEFLVHFARNCLEYKPPLSILGNVKTEERDGADVVNIKECLIPLVNFVRIFSLEYQIYETSTLGVFCK